MFYFLTSFHVAGDAYSTLEVETKSLQRLAYAASTHKTRTSQWDKYFMFCSNYDLLPLPATEEQVCNYITYLTGSLKYSSIQNYLSGLWYLHKAYGYDTCQGSFSVFQTMKGSKETPGGFG